MCFFSQPAAPQIIYQGPSQSDIDANSRALDQYRQQSVAQQQQFSTALQQQIDQANAQAESQRKALEQARLDAQAGLTSQKAKVEQDLLAARQKAELDLSAQQAGAAAQQGAQQGAAYGVAVSEVAPENPQTTAAPKPKDKRKSTLKIAPGATPMTQGAGLNIGV